MLTAVLFDDEKLALSMLNIQLAKINKIKVLAEYLEYEQLMKGITEYKPNVAFVDIETRNINGIEIAKMIKKISPKTEIVFVTAYKQYAYEAYELEAMDYLLKPVMRERLERIIDKISNKIGTTEIVENSIQINTMSKFYIKNSNGKIVKWRTKKVEELMAYLIHNKGNVLSSELIIEDLWEEKGTEKARRILYTSMYYLKKNLEEYKIDIAIDKGTYNILNNNIIDDSTVISRHMAEIRKMNEESILLYNKVLSLYSGAYMELNNYFWSNERRLNIEKKFIQLSKGAIKYYEDNNNDIKIIEIINKLLSINEYNEELYIKYLDICKKNNDDVEYNRINLKYQKIINEIKCCRKKTRRQ